MDWIPYGRLGKPHGLKGELKFYPFQLDQEICKGVRNVRVLFSEGHWKEGEVESFRGHRSPIILKLNWLHSIEDAEACRGTEIKALRNELPNPPKGKPYWFDIEGLRAYDEKGEYYGLVEEVLQTGSNDVYVVRNGDQELLLPAIDWVILKIDLKKRTLVFRLVEGLLEANAI